MFSALGNINASLSLSDGLDEARFTNNNADEIHLAK